MTPTIASPLTPLTPTATPPSTPARRVLDELQAGAVTRTYSYGLELINERQTIAGTLTTSFYGYDGHGSVRFLTSSTGAITDTYDCDAFGNLIASTGSTPNNYLFAGEQFDPALGIYYNRARYYDQRQGRFWTMDTFEGDPESPASLHKYVYVDADSVNELDPSGNVPQFGDQSFGYEVEAQVEPQYAADHLYYQTVFGPTAQRILYGKQCRLGAGFLAALACPAYRLKPDILNLSLLQWLDDKPLSPKGIANAIAKWSLYTGALGFFGITPDPVWAPQHQPLLVFNTNVWIFNLDGILFYTDDYQKYETAHRLFIVGTAVSAAWILLKLADVVGRELIKKTLEGTVAEIALEWGTASLLATEGAP